MNNSDSNDIRNLLIQSGLKEVDTFEKANIAVLNTCSVRQKAEDKVSGIGRRLINIKKERPDFVVVMTGCMSQRINRKFDLRDRAYDSHIHNQFGWVDYFVPIGDSEYLKEVLEIKSEHSNLNDNKIETISYVPISIGCNNFCSYCVVPYSRGEEKSIDYELIDKKIERLVSSNKAKIVVLLGQNVNSWSGKIGAKASKFPDLLSKIAKKYPNLWISFLTSHPKDFDANLVTVMKENKNICKYLNLPIQSGSDKVLKTMNRKYSRLEYLSKIELLKSEIPDIRLSTDIIVGFSGENDKDFQDTVEVVKKIGFSMAYISEYSQREGTSGFVIEDDIPVSEKRKRKEVLNEIIINKAKKYNSMFVGKILDVVVVGKNIAKAFDLTDVRINLGEVGDLKKVRITEASECGLVGEVVV